MHWRTYVNLYPLEKQLTKASEPSMTLKGGKGGIRRFPVHGILQVGFTFQTFQTNNKRVISTFKVDSLCLTLKKGSKVKSEHIRRFPVHDFL